MFVSVSAPSRSLSCDQLLGRTCGLRGWPGCSHCQGSGAPTSGGGCPLPRLFSSRRHEPQKQGSSSWRSCPIYLRYHKLLTIVVDAFYVRDGGSAPRADYSLF